MGIVRGVNRYNVQPTGVQNAEFQFPNNLRQIPRVIGAYSLLPSRKDSTVVVDNGCKTTLTTQIDGRMQGTPK